MSSLPEIQAGVSLHPSHSHVIKILGEKEVEVLQDIKFAPQLFMPTEDDPVSVRNGGIAQQILGVT